MTAERIEEARKSAWQKWSAPIRDATMEDKDAFYAGYDAGAAALREVQERKAMTAERIEEALARELHAVYQAEARRQGDVRHPDEYDHLPENIKEFDRVLARFVLEREAVWENALRQHLPFGYMVKDELKKAQARLAYRRAVSPPADEAQSYDPGTDEHRAGRPSPPIPPADGAKR